MTAQHKRPGRTAKAQRKMRLAAREAAWEESERAPYECDPNPSADAVLDADTLADAALLMRE